MAGIITALEIQKRNKERVNLFVDDQFAGAVSVWIAANLEKGQYLSDADLEQLKSDDEQIKAYNQAIRFLGFRPRSQMEVKDHLRNKKYSQTVINYVLNRLLAEQYLDDEAFARFWLENRERFRPRGEHALRYELKQKGIADQVIDTVLADLDEEESAWVAVESKLNRWKNLEEKDFKQKASSFLSRRGFNYEVVRNIVHRAWNSLNIPDSVDPIFDE